MQTFMLDDCAEIREELLAATKCGKDFSCLTGGEARTCPVRRKLYRLLEV